jgi:hypothetical protein
MKDVIWDTALVYPPGASWGTQAKLMVAPVVKFSAADLRSAPGLWTFSIKQPL